MRAACHTLAPNDDTHVSPGCTGVLPDRCRPACTLRTVPKIGIVSLMTVLQLAQASQGDSKTGPSLIGQITNRSRPHRANSKIGPSFNGQVSPQLSEAPMPPHMTTARCTHASHTPHRTPPGSSWLHVTLQEGLNLRSGRPGGADLPGLGAAAATWAPWPPRKPELPASRAALPLATSLHRAGLPPPWRPPRSP